MQVVRLTLIFVTALALVGVQAGGGEPPSAEAAFPGENGRLAFSGFGGNSQFNVYTMDANGTGLADLGEGLRPSWSSDGQEIAFVRSTGIWVMAANGQNKQQITATSTGPNGVHWSPDATRLVYTISDAGQSTLAIVDRTGANNQVLKTISLTQGQYLYPKWSPDGSYIAFGFQQAGVAFQFASDIWLIKPDGTDFHQLTNFGPNENAYEADWSPDGSELVVTLAKAGGSALLAFDLSGASTTITGTSGGPSSPAFSPDGQRIAYYDGPLSIAARNGTGSVTVPGGGISNFGISWQPTYAYVSGVEFTQAIQELQTVPQLLTDLDNDGEPPVAMVAGKPAAMRIYLGEVDQPTDYTVEVSGQFSDSEVVHLTAGCTLAQRRSQTSGCSSVDFFFTPPTGTWKVRLKVTEFPNTVVFDKEFELTSVYMGELDVQYLPVCVRLTGNILPTCPTSTVTSSATDLIAKLFPIAPGDLHYSRFPVPDMVLTSPMTTYPEADALLASLRFRYDLMALGNLAPDQLAGWIPGGGHSQYLGISDPVWLGSTGRVTWQTDQSSSSPLESQFTLAHEIAHNYGARHATPGDGCGASDANSGWPYPDATIQEVGFDVDAGTAISATKKDLLSYCTPPVSNIWVSPHTYNKLVDSVFVPQRIATGVESEYLVVKGSAQADGSAATIDSAYVITSSQPAQVPNPLGNYCLRTTGGAQLDYCFMLNFQEHQSGAPTDSEAFSLRIPLPPGTTRVSLAKGFQELDALELSASAPSLDITQPDELNGEETIEWSGTDGDGDPLKYAVMYSPDNGQTWYPMEVDTADTEFTFDTDVLAGDEVLLRVLASDGLNTTIETTGPVTVIHGTERTWGDNNCSGSADPVDALLALRFDAGQSTNTGQCPAMAAEITVGGISRLWGDVDCSEDVGPVDGLKLLRFDSGLSVAQEPGCPEVAIPVSVSVAALPGPGGSGAGRKRVE